MELAQLRTLRVLAETLSFTRAAERLHLTQSAVSHQIKALESELGERLFLRTSRGVRLTEAGEAALVHAERIYQETEALRERIGRRDRPPTGRVRAAAAIQLFVHVFGPVFQRLMTTYPGIELSLRTTESTDQTVSEVLDGLADVGLASMPGYAPALEVADLFEDEVVLVVAPTHRLARRRDVRAQELAAQRFVLLERGTSLRHVSDGFFTDAGIRPALALESNDITFIKLMVTQGLGIALLPSWAARDEVAAGTLARVTIRGHRLRRTVSMIWLARFQTAATRAFVDFILGHKAELQASAMPSPAPRRPNS